MNGSIVIRWLVPFVLLIATACDRESSGQYDVVVPSPAGTPLREIVDEPVALLSEMGAYGDGYFLLDHPNARVLLVGADGDVRKVVGRHGGAPGEFRLPTSATAAADGRFAVLDAPFVTVFDSLGAVLSRFDTRPSLGTIAWVCNDSMLAYSGFGDASGRQPTPVAELFTAGGTRVRSTTSWPSWSRDVNNSISLLMMSERNCVLTLVETYGAQYGSLSLDESSQAIEQRTVPWWPNPAEIMTRAVNEGATPQEVSKMIWTNRRIWHLGGDSVLVRQDSTGPDKSGTGPLDELLGPFRRALRKSNIRQ